jgi:filamentous hemagglutinin
MTMYGGGGGALSLGYGEQHASAESLTNTNSLVKANTLNITASNDATIKGATLKGDDTVNLKVGNNLSLESVRDESSTSSYGFNAGMGAGFGSGGVSSVSASAGMNSSDSLNKKVVLSSITGDKVNIDVANNTNIKGSLLAAGGEDTNGKFVDNGNLKLSTNTVTFSNLSNTSYGSSTGLQAGVSVSTTKDNTGISSASYGASTSLGYSVTKTLATLGKGDITIKDKENSDDLARLNTDTSKVNKELYSGGISSSVSGSLDTRLLTEKGRQSIKDDVQKASTIKDAITQIVTTDRAGALDFFKETEKNVKVLDGIKSTIANNPELAQNLSNPNLTPEQKQAMLNDVASSVAISLGYIPASTKLVYTDEPGANGETVKGHYSKQTNTSYINDKYNNSTKELVSTTGHETQHAMDAQAGVKVTDKADNEKYATNFGNMVSNYTDYALGSTGNQSMADTNNHNGALTLNSPTQTVNIITNPLLSQNNGEFAGVDKGMGEDFSFKNAWKLSKENYSTTMNTISIGPFNAGNTASGMSVVAVGNSPYSNGLFYKGPYQSTLGWASSGFKAGSVGYVDTVLFRVVEPVAIGTAAFSVGVGIGSLGVGVYKEIKGQ